MKHLVFWSFYLFLLAAKNSLGVLTLWIKIKATAKKSKALELRHDKCSSIIRKSSVHLFSCYNLWLAIKGCPKFPCTLSLIRKCLRRNCLTHVFMYFSFNSMISLVLIQLGYNHGQNTFRLSHFKHSLPSPQMKLDWLLSLETKCTSCFTRCFRLKA